MKRNFVVGLFGGLAMLLMLLSAAGVAGARGQDPAGLQAPDQSMLASTPLTSTFTYQGQLKQGNTPVNGSCQMAFRLYDDPTASTNLIGLPITTTVPVSNGLFTVGLNFGSSAFNGDGRWLNIQINCGSGFVALTPRQSITAAPYALALPGLYTQQNAYSPNIIGGYSGNVISSTVEGGVIAGGGANGLLNRVTNGYGVVGGGLHNTANGWVATIGGGDGNTANGYYAAIGGGYGNTANGNSPAIGGGSGNTTSNNFAAIGGGSGNIASGDNFPTIGGGWQNTANGTGATVSGGAGNTASGTYATVPGGLSNSAAMSYTFAAGRRAKANHDGAFVWADSTDADFASTANNQFLIRANGGAGININEPKNASLQVAKDFSGSGGYGQIEAIGATNPSKRLTLGFDTTNNLGWIQASETNVGLRNLALNPSGLSNVMIGTTSDSSDRLTVSGDIRVGTSGTNGCIKRFDGTALAGSCSSDARLKQNITAFPNVLDKVTRLQPVYYNWRAADYPAYHFDGSTRSYGVIAQEVEQVLPELVGTDEQGFKTVNYSEIPLLLLQALKDLRAEKDTQIAAQQKQIEDLQTRLANLDPNVPPASFNLFNVLSVIAFGGFAGMWLQQRRSKRGEL